MLVVWTIVLRRDISLTSTIVVGMSPTAGPKEYTANTSHLANLIIKNHLEYSVRTSHQALSLNYATQLL
jgi:hypothetical protein